MSFALAAFQKWGQWAATRGDLFPQDFCDVMGTLHDAAPEHSLRHSRKEIRSAFGRELEDIFLEFGGKPIASGSVAQVHRAVLADPDAPDGRCQVAVKVRHPGVATSIARDFRILKPLAGIAGRFRALKGLSLQQTLSQFSHTMTAQTDLRVEAAHLERSGRDFGADSNMVIIPRVVQGLVSPSVLVESWEPGRSLAHFCKKRTPLNTQLVGLGVDAYLAMLLSYNFVHTDLHPGNILVRMVDQHGNAVDQATSQRLLAEFLGEVQTGRNTSQHAQHARSTHRHDDQTEEHIYQPQLVLLDYGLAEELTPKVRYHFISFLNCLAPGDGKTAAYHILNWSERQACPDPAAFTRAVQQLFKTHCNIHHPQGVNLDDVMKAVLKLACQHEVTIDSSYASLAIAVCVIVGFATSLDPNVNLLDAATPCLLAYALTGKVMGRLYS